MVTCFRYLLLLLLIGMLSGCAMNCSVPVRPSPGFLVTKYTAPLQVNFDNTPVCTKKGSTSTWYVRDILFTRFDVAFDNAAIERAAQEGNLSKVEYADYELLAVLGFIGRFTVTAYGN